MSQAYTEAWITDGPQTTAFYTRTYNISDDAKPKAHLVFVHGFIEHIERYHAVFSRWARNGISVFAYDQRGFGRTAIETEKSPSSSYGKTSWKDQMEDISFFIIRERLRLGTGVPIFLMGHSMVRFNYAGPWQTRILIQQQQTRS